jgi:hypothetical protein
MKHDEQVTLHKHKGSPPNTTGPIKSRKMRWVEHGNHLARVLTRRPEGRRRLGRTRRRRKDNISMDLTEIGWEVCIALRWLRMRAERALVNMVRNLWVP